MHPFSEKIRTIHAFKCVLNFFYNDFIIHTHKFYNYDDDDDELLIDDEQKLVWEHNIIAKKLWFIKFVRIFFCVFELKSVQRGHKTA